MMKKTNNGRKNRSYTGLNSAQPKNQSQDHVTDAWLCTKVRQFWLDLRSEGPGLRDWRMYFWMVRLHTRISSLSSSPLIRLAPHSRFSTAICLISFMVSAASLGWREAVLDFLLQDKRKPARCQRSRV